MATKGAIRASKWPSEIGTRHHGLKSWRGPPSPKPGGAFLRVLLKGWSNQFQPGEPEFGRRNRKPGAETHVLKHGIRVPHVLKNMGHASHE